MPDIDESDSSALELRNNVMNDWNARPQEETTIKQYYSVMMGNYSTGEDRTDSSQFYNLIHASLSTDKLRYGQSHNNNNYVTMTKRRGPHTSGGSLGFVWERPFDSGGVDIAEYEVYFSGVDYDKFYSEKERRREKVMEIL